MGEPADNWQPYLKLVPDAGTSESDKVYRKAKTGGGSGNGGPTVDAETKHYLDAKVDAVKAQNDARFTEVISRLDVLKSDFDSAPKPVGFWQLAGMIASALVVGFTLLGVFADRFDGGISAYGLLDTHMEDQSARDAAQDARLDRILDALETRNDQPQGSPQEGQD